jgi:hypothetical protein
MKCGTGAALAIGAGYVLGRRRKMRMAAVLAGATAVGGIGGLGGSVLKRGVAALGSTDLLGGVAPQLSEITDKVRGDLLDAGKAAALAAVTGRIDSLTDSLHERADILRAPAGQAAEAAEQATGAAGEAAQGVRRKARPARSVNGDRRGAPAGEDRGEPEEADESEDSDEFEDSEEFEDADEFEDTDEPEAEEPEPEEPEAAPARRRTRSDRPAVSRARR